jgi:hypothetical protein
MRCDYLSADLILWPFLTAAIASLVEHANRLAGAKPRRKLNFAAQRRGRPFFEHVTPIVVAQFENSRRRLDAAAVALAKIMINDNSHRSFPIRPADALAAGAALAFRATAPAAHLDDTGGGGVFAINNSQSRS